MPGCLRNAGPCESVSGGRANLLLRASRRRGTPRAMTRTLAKPPDRADLGRTTSAQSGSAARRKAEKESQWEPANRSPSGSFHRPSTATVGPLAARPLQFDAVERRANLPVDASAL